MEGGVYPWKRAKHNATPAPDYKRLLKPLPTPPAGLSWIRDDQTPQKWILVAHTNVVPVVAMPRNMNHGNDDVETTTTARIVPFETEALISSNGTTETAVFAQATVHSNDALSLNHGTNKNDDAHDEGLVLLPMASMVHAPDGAPSSSLDPLQCPPSHHGASKNGKEEEEPPPFYTEFTEHVVMPTDTLAGICLTYKIGRRELQKINKFSGDNLRLAPGTLWIPITEKARRLGYKAQNVQSPEFKMAAVLAQHPSLSMMEAKCYLETNDWDLPLALEEAHQDAAWERQEAERLQQKQLQALAWEKKMQQQDNDNGTEKDHEGRELECLACFSFLIKAIRSLSQP